MKILCVIPARGGSKRITRKNIRTFIDRPIISYSISTAILSGIFDRVMVSTEDKEIADVARRYGATIPFMRSPETADDFTGIAEVLIETIHRLNEMGENYNIVCCILPTSPLLDSDRILNSVRILESENSTDAVLSVAQYDSPIQRALKKNSDGTIDMLWPENRLIRSQDLEPRFFDAGQYYTLRTEVLLNSRSVFPPNTKPDVLDNRMVQDIDNLDDWELAELKYKLLKHGSRS
jgi:pseudaminic acid cytidylyltransferase